MKLNIRFKDRHNEFQNSEQEITIDLETMAIQGNEVDGEFGDVWSKVVDTGVYTLFTETEILTIEDYVPDCIPNEGNDYIDLEVESQVITNWTSSKEEILKEFKTKGTR